MVGGKVWFTKLTIPYLQTKLRHRLEDDTTNPISEQEWIFFNSKEMQAWLSGEWGFKFRQIGLLHWMMRNCMIWSEKDGWIMPQNHND